MQEEKERKDKTFLHLTMDMFSLQLFLSQHAILLGQQLKRDKTKSEDRLSAS